VFGTITGSIAGLATITAASGFVGVGPAMAIGLIASVICFVCVSVVKPKLGYDDSLDAFGVHGIGGIIGMMTTGLFASKAINAAGADGLFFGNAHLFLVQCFAVLVVTAYSLGATFIICKAVDLFVTVRVPLKEEIIGLDLTQHHETAYTVME
jgi:Amt family ammonium transporter